MVTCGLPGVKPTAIKAAASRRASTSSKTSRCSPPAQRLASIPETGCSR